MLVGVLIAMVYAQHGSWQDKYTNAEGMRCCGPVDCQAVPVSIVLHDGAKVQALVMGIAVTVPAASVHPSEDMRSYWCAKRNDEVPVDDNVRCLFYVVGS